MNTIYNLASPKKPTNLTVNSDLLSIAKKLKINLSATLETALAEKIKEHHKRIWLAQNESSITSYNEFVHKGNSNVSV